MMLVPGLLPSEGTFLGCSHDRELIGKMTRAWRSKGRNKQLQAAEVA
jgi:hypothetical protein